MTKITHFYPETGRIRCHSDFREMVCHIGEEKHSIKNIQVSNEYGSKPEINAQKEGIWNHLDIDFRPRSEHNALPECAVTEDGSLLCASDLEDEFDFDNLKEFKGE